MRNLVPLMRLFASAGTIDGRTKIQKMVYILQNMGYPFRETYRYHLHGPYAQALTHEVSHLVNLGLLKETTQGIADMKRFSYETTSELHDFLFDVEQSVPQSLHSEEFDRAVSELNKQSSPSLEIAATALYLRKSGMADEDLAEKLQQLKPHLAKSIGPALQYLEKLTQRGWVDTN